jgi:hypothetical protein
MTNEATSEARPDIRAAVDRMRSKYGAKREIRKLPDYLWEGEQVERLTGGTYGPGQGLVTLTDRRLLFLMDGLVHKMTEDFPIEKISSVQWSSSVVFGSIVVFAAGNKAEIKNVDKTDGKAIVDAMRAQLNRGSAVTADQSSIGTSKSPDVMAQLEKLGELRDAGVVTDDEFESKKAELLARL